MKNIFVLSGLIFIIALFNSCGSSNQAQEVAASIEILKKGMIDADRNLLESITADDLVFVHSTGNAQNKSEFIDEVVSGKSLDYLTIEMTDQTIKIAGKIAIVRNIFSAETSRNGTPGNLKIGIMMIWQKNAGKWKMLARQGYKL